MGCAMSVKRDNPRHRYHGEQPKVSGTDEGASPRHPPKYRHHPTHEPIAQSASRSEFANPRQAPGGSRAIVP